MRTAAKIMVLLVLLCSTEALALPYQSYSFDYWSETVSAAQAYVPRRVIGSRELGATLSNPQDIFVTDEYIFLLDTGNNRILVFDHEWKLSHEISEFENSGEMDKFNNPRGLYVSPEGILYVADQNNARIVQMTQEGQFIQAFGEPKSDVEGVIPEGFRYRPRKIVVDVAGRMYVISEGTFDGILEFDDAGQFRGFIGAPRIRPNIVDYIWSRIVTDEQRSRRALFLPTEYSNLHIDESGFIYATVSGLTTNETDAIRRLNPSGKDVLRRQGFFPPVGDVQYPYAGLGASIEGRSVFVDVVSREHGIYSALDIRRGRVFTYDSNGSLLYVFGGPGDQIGLVQGPAAIEALGDNLLVLDSQLARITVYEPTPYAQYIHAAIAHHQAGEYEQAADMWRRTLAYNANLDQAYSGIGRSLLRQDRFAEAMEYFRLGNNRRDYSKALALYRREVIFDNFPTIMTGLVAAALGLFLLIKTKPYAPLKERLNSYYGWNPHSRHQTAFAQDDVSGWRLKARLTIRALWYAVYVSLHPFDGFWDLKYEKRGNMAASNILLVLLVFTNAFGRQFTGFVLNPNDLTKLNILMEVAVVIVPFVLWVVVNWSLTTLFEGKGTFGQIWIATAYSLTPLILVNIPMTIVSNFITLEEAAFYYVITAIAGVWALALVFIGNMVTHEFFVAKTIWSSCFTLAGMLLVAFIGLLFFSLIGEMTNFAASVYREVTFRM